MGGGRREEGVRGGDETAQVVWVYVQLRFFLSLTILSPSGAHDVVMVWDDLEMIRHDTFHDVFRVAPFPSYCSGDVAQCKRGHLTCSH